MVAARGSLKIGPDLTSRYLLTGHAIHHLGQSLAALSAQVYRPNGAMLVLHTGAATLEDLSPQPNPSSAGRLGMVSLAGALPAPAGYTVATFSSIALIHFVPRGAEKVHNLDTFEPKIFL